MKTHQTTEPFNLEPSTPGVGLNANSLELETLERLEEELASLESVWRQQLKRDNNQNPSLSVEFVAQRGRSLTLIDLRQADELLGPFGHIPSVIHLPLKELARVTDELPLDEHIILISNHGDRAALGAKLLESLGMSFVAALEGGMQKWKELGYCARRDQVTYVKELKSALEMPITTKGAVLNERDIEAHLGDPSTIRWVKLATFLLNGKRSCVDGRDEGGVIGTPGGDAGELVLGFAALERLRGAPLSAEDVHSLVQRYFDVFGRFYMHSDTHATERLIEDLIADDRLKAKVAKLEGVEGLVRWLASPPLELHEPLLEHLCKPKNMGCGHLKFVMSDEAHYHVRPELTEHFLRAFHKLRWAGSPEAEWVTLGGHHAERAVLSITLEESLKSWTRVPLISPQVNGQQVFVNHPQVNELFRSELASFFCFEGWLPVAREAELAEAMQTLAGEQAGHTLARLAKDLPVFEVRFKSNRLSEVKALGAI